MSGNFFRKPINNSFDPTQDLPYESTAIPGDESWSLIANADFLVFDRERGLQLLGSRPKNTHRFTVAEAVHEAPVHTPLTNELYLSQLRPGYLPQLVVNLNKPTTYPIGQDS